MRRAAALSYRSAHRMELPGGESRIPRTLNDSSNDYGLRSTTPTGTKVESKPAESKSPAAEQPKVEADKAKPKAKAKPKLVESKLAEAKVE